MLQVHQLSKSYGQTAVLQDLSFEIQVGDVYGLLGPNGSGKTTTINMICGLLAADRGTIMINQQPISHATKSIIGVAPQENLLYKTLTCEQNLDFFARIYGLSSQKQRSQAIAACLEGVGLTDRAKSPVETLSGGMQRRLNIAIALVHNPQLVILDEPTAGLDLEARYEIWELIRQLQSQRTTVLLTTHMLDEAERLCQHIGILKHGQLLAEGTISELRKWVVAEEVVMIQTQDEKVAIARAQELGFKHRYYGNELAFWLPKPMELKEIILMFDGIPLDAITRQRVCLEHIYLEVTQDHFRNC